MALSSPLAWLSGRPKSERGGRAVGPALGGECFGKESVR
jgi:hypothetical protein